MRHRDELRDTPLSKCAEDATPPERVRASSSRPGPLRVPSVGPRPRSRPSPRERTPGPGVRLGWRTRLADPMAQRRHRPRHHADHRLGYELLLPGRAGGPDQSGHRLEPGLRVPRLHRRAARHGPRVERGGPRHRPARRASGDDARHRARVDRPVRARPCPQRGGVPGRVGVPRPRHAPVPVRRRVRRPGAGRALAGADGDLLPHPVRGVRLVGVLGGRSRAERAGRLAADPRPVRPHQSGGVPAAALARSRAA